MQILKSTFLIALTIFTFILTSCKKDDSNYDSVPKIKTHTYNSASLSGYVTDTYSYDNQGRVISIVGTGADNAVFSYAYSGNTVNIISSKTANTAAYTLNSRGYAVLFEIKDTLGNSIGELNFTYDIEGHLISDFLGNYELIGNNKVMAFVLGDTVTYTYLTDKTNTIGNANEGKFFLGKDSKNLIDTRTIPDSTIQYVYQYDSENRVINVNGETYTYY